MVTGANVSQSRSSSAYVWLAFKVSFQRRNNLCYCVQTIKLQTIRRSQPTAYRVGNISQT